VDLWHDFYPSWNLSSREVNQTFSSPLLYLSVGAPELDQRLARGRWGDQADDDVSHGGDEDGTDAQL
ncbi:hypothetical protein, partial [Brevibacterium linens]|uniref:hypothetical protein n=1 Tax=Brevibacterium linens TaxID=1703 RepID=UPI003510FDCC